MRKILRWKIEYHFQWLKSMYSKVVFEIGIFCGSGSKLLKLCEPERGQ